MIVVAQRGDCLSSIAAEHGFDWETVWNHPSNAQLKAARKDPNVLAVGDQVFVPEKEPPGFSGETRRRHSFVLKGTPARLRMVFQVEGEPRANEPYTLEVDGEVTEGTLDGDGLLDVRIAPTARQARIWLEGRDEPLDLALGGLEPKDTLAGVQQRLNNLGFFCGEADGQFGPRTHGALLRFQRREKLDLTGQCDAGTVARLEALHGAQQRMQP